MVGIPVIAAETDEQAQRFATTPALKFLQLIRGEPFLLSPPVDSMDGIWSPQERALVHMKLGAQIVGGPETIKRKLADFLRQTQADELMISSDLYHHADRLRSYEIVAEIMKNLAPEPRELASANR
jgi:alkanesulfonate monooxygenase SsuD/methylene tetrahydromethanopterin reductase-like flavin-dependent oxidoreductase (luciferase family)